VLASKTERNSGDMVSCSKFQHELWNQIPHIRTFFSEVSSRGKQPILVAMMKALFLYSQTLVVCYGGTRRTTFEMTCVST
jgi:hypothetical protein